MLNKFVCFLCVALTLAMFNETILASTALKCSIYVVQVVFIVWLYYVARKNGVDPFRKRLVVILLFLVISNFLWSPYRPNYSWIIKYISYILSFEMGCILYIRRKSLKVNKLVLSVIVLLPLFLVGIVDKTPHKTVFFVFSNSYSFTGLALSLLFYTIYSEKKNAFFVSLGILFLYIISCSSLGIVGAVFLAVLIINRRNKKLMIYSFFCCAAFGLLVAYSDFEFCKRIRDVFKVLSSMTPQDWHNLKYFDHYGATQGMNFESSRTDNTSIIWRLGHWIRLLESFFENWIYAIPFGLGDSYTLRILRNHPHNDYLRVLCEYGAIVFFIVMKYMKRTFKVMTKDKSFYFVCAYFVYFFTENIIDTFVANAIMFMCIGFHYSKCKASPV